MRSTVEAYLRSLPAGRRAALSRIREVILKNLDPAYEEGMQYGVIGYYVPHRVYPKSSELIRQALFSESFWKPATGFQPTLVTGPSKSPAGEATEGRSARRRVCRPSSIERGLAHRYRVAVVRRRTQQQIALER